MGGDADVGHTQIIGGYSQIIEGDIVPHPPGFPNPCVQHSDLAS